MDNIIEPEYMESRAGCVSRLKPRSCQDCHIRGGFEYHCEIFTHRISSVKGYEGLMEKLHCSGFCQDVGQKADAIAYQLGWVADAPGWKSLALWDTEPEEIDAYFPELAPLVEDCQFSDCGHIHEPGCAVLAGIQAGTVSRQRYESYLRLKSEG
mgnify:CR=1 FL=1